MGDLSQNVTLNHGREQRLPASHKAMIEGANSAFMETVRGGLRFGQVTQHWMRRTESVLAILNFVLWQFRLMPAHFKPAIVGTHWTFMPSCSSLVIWQE
jgi:hypothetical protein